MQYIFLALCQLSFDILDVLSKKQKVLILMKANLSIFSFIAYASGGQESFAYPKSK